MLIILEHGVRGQSMQPLIFFGEANNSDQQIQEAITDFPAIDMRLCDKSKGRMFASELLLSKTIGNGTLLLGSEYTNTYRLEDFLSNASSITGLYNTIRENNIGIYSQISQTFGRVILQAGLRFEHINSYYHEVGVKTPENTYHYNEFLPSISMVLPLKQTIFQLSYSRKYSRPLYAQLSSSVHYVDQYTYETGNPNLKNAFTDNLSLNLKYKWLMVMASTSISTTES